VTYQAHESDAWIGRTRELEIIASAVDRLGHGEGSVVWVEGEPGIGKSTLTAAGIAGAAGLGYEVMWATADQLSQRSPLGVMFTCLGVRLRSPDPRRAEIAHFLLDQSAGMFPGDEAAHAAAAEMLVALVDELCMTAPMIMVIDDLHWADRASKVVWERLALAAGQLPLMLVGISGPTPRGARSMRPRTTDRPYRRAIFLEPLTTDEVTALMTSLIGAPPGPTLTEWAAAAMGNPLYLRELIDVLTREDLLVIDGSVAELSRQDPSRVPPALADSLSGRLALVSASSAAALRMAALLGDEFAVTDLATLLGQPVTALATDLQEALDARILVGPGSPLKFRHALIRQTLYDSAPLPVRTALHLDAARTLASADSDPLAVAQQLLMADHVDEAWIRGWLSSAVTALAARAPGVAAELLHRQLDQPSPTDMYSGPLAVALSRVLLGMGEYEQAAFRARVAVTRVSRPEDRGEVYWILTRALISDGRTREASDTLRQALGRPGLPAAWRARLLASLAMTQRAADGELDEADSTARAALAEAEAVDDAFASAYALTNLWLSHSVKRDHVAALRYIDKALEAISHRPDHADLHIFALHCKIFNLQNLCRWTDAEAALRQARDVARKSGYVTGVATGITEAVLLYWLGQWDDALAQLTSVEEDTSGISYAGLRERGPALLWHGVAALVAGRRDDRVAAAEHLRQGSLVPVETVGDRENHDFLHAARACAAEQAGDLRQAVSALSVVLHRQPGEMTLSHQWLADLVRVGLAAGDDAVVSDALRMSRVEAAAETTPGRAAAMRLRCEGLIEVDAEPLREAVAHYRAAGPPVDLAATLEDLAVVLASQGHATECRAALNEAVELYSGFGAAWDIRRAEARLRRFGIRRGVHGARGRRPESGWTSLTDTERRVAMLIADGRSTIDIAANLFLARRTVQTHISRILTKLGLRSRVEIASEVLRIAPNGRSSPA
jgi:DNA-binding CsgD family transcriptional regulator/tetratricopeptide (TPR) repeat protein